MNDLENNIDLRISTAFEVTSNKFNYKKFEHYLDYSSRFELYVKNMFEEKGWEFIQFNENKDYDIMMYNKKKEVKLIEVKSDDKSYYTGNVVFEYSSHNKPSGIKSTKADIWVHVLPKRGEVWFMNVSILRQVIKEYNAEINDNIEDCWTAVPSGDGEDAKCYKWNIKRFIKIMGKDLLIIKRYNMLD